MHLSGFLGLVCKHWESTDAWVIARRPIHRPLALRNQGAESLAVCEIQPSESPRREFRVYAYAYMERSVSDEVMDHQYCQRIYFYRPVFACPQSSINMSIIPSGNAGSDRCHPATDILLAASSHESLALLYPRHPSNTNLGSDNSKTAVSEAKTRIDSAGRLRA